MSENEPKDEYYGSMTPPDPPLPMKTWRGTLAIAVASLFFLAILAFVVDRWAALQSFSPELRSEGYYRFSGKLEPPVRVFASDLIKLRIATGDGKTLVLPPVPEVRGDGRTLAGYPPGTCVEGYVHNRKNFLAQVQIKIEGKTYLLNGSTDWLVIPSD